MAMTLDELIGEFRADFDKRRFSAGLLLAFIRFFRALDAFDQGFRDFAGFLERYPLSNVSARGGTANTLTVEVADTPGSTPPLLSIRPAYNQAERLFRVEKKRFDYPNCGPHATGQWRDYVRWLDALLQLSAGEAAELEQSVIDWVLQALASHEIDPSSLAPLERRFTRLLEEFDLSKQGREPFGAAFQGVIYAYIRADAPHLHLEVARAGAGSKRLGRIGDVDGWDGERLVLSVEVKHFLLDTAHAGDLEPFLAEVTKRNALAIIAAESFSSEARARVLELGGRALDVPGLLALVDLWDPLKQRAALQAFVYYVHHIEKKKPLMDRLSEFLRSIDGPIPSRAPDEAGAPTDPGDDG